MDDPASGVIPEVTADDLLAYDWQSVVNAVAERDCIHYYGPLFAVAGKLKEEGDMQGERVYHLLSLTAAASLPAQVVITWLLLFAERRGCR